MNKKQIIKIVLYFIIALAVVLIDQLKKQWLYGQSFSVIGNILWIESSFNTGAAFSMMSGALWFFITVAVIACIIMIYLLISKKWGLTTFNKISIALVLGGAIGNLIDRIIFGGVRDFIYFKSINFAIFNIADAAVTVGGVLLVVGIIIEIIKAFAKKEKTN